MNRSERRRYKKLGLNIQPELNIEVDDALMLHQIIAAFYKVRNSVDIMPNRYWGKMNGGWKRMEDDDIDKIRDKFERLVNFLKLQYRIESGLATPAEESALTFVNASVQEAPK